MFLAYLSAQCLDCSQIRSAIDTQSNIERLGRYQIRKIIGEGAMAKVYSAYDPDINRPLAIKILKSQLRMEGEYHSRFLQSCTRREH